MNSGGTIAKKSELQKYCPVWRTKLGMLYYTNIYFHNSSLPSYFITVIIIMILTKDKNDNKFFKLKLQNILLTLLLGKIKNKTHICV